MKRLVSAVLALSLLGTAAASAQPFRGTHDYGRDRGYHRDYRGATWNRGHNDNGAAIGLGIGLFALAAILASSQQQNDRYRYNNYNGYYGR